MKAKCFKKLRIECQYFEVEFTGMLFGDFEYNFNGDLVLARNHREAARRFKKRKGKPQSADNETTSQWGVYKVKLQNKPDHHRHFKYYH